MSLSSYNGHSNFTIRGKKFIKRGADNIYDIASVAGTSGNFSTGWVNSGVANGATLTFNHNLGTTDLVIDAYYADDGDGLNAKRLHAPIYTGGITGGGATSTVEGYDITAITNSNITVQLGSNGIWGNLDSSGNAYAGEATATSFTGKYIKVVASAGGGGGTSGLDVNFSKSSIATGTAGYGGRVTSYYWVNAGMSVRHNRTGMDFAFGNDANYGGAVAYSAVDYESLIIGAQSYSGGYPSGNINIPGFINAVYGVYDLTSPRVVDSATTHPYSPTADSGFTNFYNRTGFTSSSPVEQPGITFTTTTPYTQANLGSTGKLYKSLDGKLYMTDSGAGRYQTNQASNPGYSWDHLYPIHNVYSFHMFDAILKDLQTAISAAGL